MKKLSYPTVLLCLTLLVVAAIVLFGCDGKPKANKYAKWNTVHLGDDDTLYVDVKPSVFHVSVKLFGSFDCAYYVAFTNDDWETEEKIMETFDLSDVMGGKYVCFQERIFHNVNQAALFASQFKTYYDCMVFNIGARAEYERLLLYRDKHPCPPKVKEVCAKEIKIY